MLQLTPLSIIFVATCYVDFRKGIDSLAAFCKNHFVIEPMNGALFLFYNKTHTTIKILAYDGQGFTLFIKRLSKGTFQANPHKGLFLHNSTQAKSSINNPKDSVQICHKLLQLLINNGDPTTIKFSKDWRPLRSN